MEAEKINLFIATKGDYFPAETIPMIKERMTYLASDNEMAIMAADYTNPILFKNIRKTSFLLWMLPSGRTSKSLSP